MVGVGMVEKMQRVRTAGTGIAAAVGKHALVG